MAEEGPDQAAVEEELDLVEEDIDPAAVEELDMGVENRPETVEDTAADGRDPIGEAPDLLVPSEEPAGEAAERAYDAHLADEEEPEQPAPNADPLAESRPVPGETTPEPDQELAPTGAADGQAAAPDLSAELKAAEEVAAEQVTAVLTAVLDRLGSAHHRPFSRP
jgi:hypothetical protein